MEQRDRPALGNSLAGRIAVMDGVRGGEDGFPVELWRDDETGRLVVVAYTDAGYGLVTIDLPDLIGWLRSSTRIFQLSADEAATISLGTDVRGDAQGT